MVAAVAAPGQRIGGGFALEISTGDVVEQQVVIERKQLAQALLQMRLERLLVRQQLVERAVQAVIVYPLLRHAEQIRQRRAAIPILGNVQLARRLAQSRDHQDRCHYRPRHTLASFGHPRGTEPVESQRTP